METQKISKNLEKIVRFCLYASVAAPLILSDEFFFPAIFPKAIYIRLLAEIALIAYVPLAMIEPKFRPKFHVTYIALAVFAVVVFLASITGENFAYSFWGNYERMDGIFSWMHYWMLIVVAASVFRSRRGWMKLLSASVVCAVLMSFYGFLQRAGAHSIGPLTIYETNMGRITGTIANPAFLAAYLLFNIAFALVVSVNNRLPRWWRFAAVASLAPILAAYFMTGIRGAFVGLLAGAAFFVFGSLVWCSSRRIKRAAYLVGIVFVFLIAGLYSLKDSSDFVQKNFGRYFSMSLSDSTVQTRLTSWHGAWRGFLENPILGVGPQKFDVVFNEYFDPDFYTLVGNETWWDRAHNMVLEVMATMGILGFLSYAGVGLSFVYALRQSAKREPERKPETLILFSFLIAYFIQNLFVFDTVVSYLMLSVLVGYIVFRTMEFNVLRDKFASFIQNFNRMIPENWPDKCQKFWIAGLAASVLIIVPVSWARNIKLIKPNRLLVYNVAYANSKPFDQVMEDYRKIVSISDFDIREISMKIGRYLGPYSLQNKMSVRKLKSEYAFAIETLDKAAGKNPKDVRLFLTFGNTLNIYGEILKQFDKSSSDRVLEKSENILRRAVELGKTRQQVYYSLANTYIIRQEYEKGIRVLENAVAIDKNTPTAHWILAIAYAKAGYDEDAIESVSKALENNYFFSNEREADNVAAVLAENGETELLLEMYKKVARDTKTAAARAKVAATLAQTGRTEEAIKEAEKVKRINPFLKDEVQEFIDKIKSGEKANFLSN